MTDPSAEPPLAGITVLDFTWNLPGPYATWVLAGLGAEVIKVEPPRGDPARHLGPLFQRVNQGKSSVVIDRDDPDRQARLDALVARADVLVEGFRPGKIDQLGVAPEAATTLNPRLVYCSISAYGQGGPRRDEPGHDLNAQAIAGTLHLDRDPAGRPRVPALPVADLSAATTAVSRILAALLARERTGRGAVLDVAMVDTAAVWADVWGAGVDLGAVAGDHVPPRYERVARPLVRKLQREGLRALPHYDVFRCADGAWLALGIVDEDRFWRELCDDLGMGWARGLPMPARAALGSVLRPLLARRLRRRPRRHWLDLWAARLPVSPVHDLSEAATEAQLAGRVLGPLRPFPGAADLPPAPSLGGSGQDG